MRVLMINYEFPPIGGGGGNVTYYISKNLAQLGHHVAVITSQFKDLPKYENLDGVEIHRIPVLRKNPNVCGVHEMMSFVVSASLYSLKFVKKFQPDIIHVFFGIPSGPVAYLLKKVYSIPYVVFLGGRDVPRPHPDPPFYRLIYGFLKPAIKSIWGNAKCVVACSSGLREMALKTNHNANIQVIPDGVDLKRFHPAEEKADNGKVKILAIGRLIPRKGFDFLIKSLPEVSKLTDKDFCVEIVGDGPLRNDLNHLAERLNVKEKVFFAGSVPYEQLDSKYQQADVFVLSSLAEGMPLVILEAMASGLPIVSSKVQGIDEVVKQGRNGYIFPPADHLSMGKYLAELIKDDNTRQKMGIESTKIIKEYDWANITKRYLSIYEN